jgi:uncharacterized membrane protein
MTGATRPSRLTGVATAAFAVGFGALATLQHQAFWSGRFDLGNLTQAVWSTAHFHPLEMTDLQGRQISRLGAHFDPIVAAFAPLWWVWPSPSLLLAVQAAAVAAGAPAAYLLARKHLASDWAGLGFALAYLLYPATQWLVLDDFHPVALATPLLLWGFWFLDGDRLVAFALVAIPAALSKEQIGLTVAAMGLWYAVTKGHRRAGAVIALAGVAVSLFAVVVVVPHFAPGGGSPFAGRYDAVGGSPQGIVKTAITDPSTLVSEVTETRDLTYVRDLLAPLLGLSLLSPVTALTALPELALNLLSSTRTQTSIHFHYTAGSIPGLFVAAILGAARVRRRWASVVSWLPKALVLALVGAGVLLGPLPIYRHVPFGSDLAAREHVVGPHARAAARALRVIPPDATVSATNTLGAHLSERARITSFPILRHVDWVAVDTTRPSYLDAAVAPDKFRVALATLERSGQFRLIREDDGVRIYRRT